MAAAWDAEQRAQLTADIDHVFNLHENLEKDLDTKENGNYQALIKSIDQWEVKAKAKIEKTARKAREDLEKLYKNTKIQIRSSLKEKVTEPLRTALQNKDQFDERDIDQWLANLAELRKQLDYFSGTVDLKAKKRTLELIEIQQITTTSVSKPRERFCFYALQGEMRLDSPQRIIGITQPGLIVSENNFLQGSHYFRFRIQRATSNIFFGIISAKHVALAEKKTRPIPSIHGWWNIDRRVIADQKDSHVSSLKFFNQDEIIFILNCDARQLYLHFPSMRKINRIQMVDDTELCSSPWKILIEVVKPAQCLIQLMDTGRMADGQTFS